MTSPDMGPGGSWEAPDGSRPWNTGDSSPDGLAYMAAADEEHWRETAFRQPFRDSYNPIGSWSNGVSGLFSGIISGIFNGWFGGSETVTDPLAVEFTVKAIHDAVISGNTVITVTSSGTRTIPADITEAYAIVVGCGANGQNGQGSAPGNRSIGGGGGGYIVEALDPATVAGQTLTCTVGVSDGSPSVVALGGTELAKAQAGMEGGIANGVFGYGGTTSRPGKGGDGGWGWTSDSGAVAGLPGESSAKATGGNGGAAGGSGNHGSPGTAGQNYDPAANVKCAGGGGGGGGGGGSPTAIFQGRNGGSAGPGGYPGGGGGGGGGRSVGSVSSGAQGAGGIGATGIIWLVYR